jgi:hypothetical protein
MVVLTGALSDRGQTPRTYTDHDQLLRPVVIKLFDSGGVLMQPIGGR